jgi:hypothetical protein
VEVVPPRFSLVAVPTSSHIRDIGSTPGWIMGGTAEDGPEAAVSW